MFSLQPFALPRRTSALASLCFAALLAGNPVAGIAQSPTPSPEAFDFARIPAEPLAFEHNSGQAPPAYRYLLHAPGVTAGFTNDGLVLALSDTSSAAGPKDGSTGSSNERVLHFRWLGANHATPVAEDQQPSRLRYIDSSTGLDGNNALREVAKSGRIRYRGLYDGIDLLYYPSGGELEFDLELAPYADPQAPVLEIAGADRLELDSSGALIIHAGTHRLRQRAPVSFQHTRGQRAEVHSRFQLLTENRVRMQVGPYDRSLNLTIDPVLEVATIFGGKETNYVSSVATDSAGNIYIEGWLNSPRLPGESIPPINPTGPFGLFYISKISADLSSVLMTIHVNAAAFSSNTDPPKIDIAPDGTMYFVYNIAVSVGNVNPTTGPFGGPYPQNWPNNLKTAVIAIDPSGATLRFRTALGCDGDLSEPLIHAANDGITLAGSATCWEFPVSAGAFTKARTGSLNSRHGYVARIAANGATMPYSTVIGGAGETAITSLEIDSAGRIWLGGWTSSSDFPVSGGAYDGALDGATDAFVMRLSADGGTLEASTLYGSSGEERLASLHPTSNGEVVVVTEQVPSGFPASPNAFMPVGDGNTRVIARFSEDLKSLRWATHYPYERGMADWALNEADEPVIVTRATSLATLPITPNALLHKIDPVLRLHIGRLSADGSSATFGSMYFESSLNRIVSWKGSVLTLMGESFKLWLPPITTGPLTVDQTGIPYGTYFSRINLADPTVCTPRISPESQTVSGSPTSASLHVDAAPGCPWMAVSLTSFSLDHPTIVPGAGVGSRDITFTMERNPSSVNPKEHSVIVDGNEAKVIQEPIRCDVQEVIPAIFQFGPEGGTAKGDFKIGMECDRLYEPGDLWLTVVDHNEHAPKPLDIGGISFTLRVPPNSFEARSTTFQLGNVSILVSQQAGACTSTVTPSSADLPASGGTVSVSLAASGSACGWSAVTSPGLAIEGSSSGTGSAVISVTVPPNPSNQPRTETVSVAGKTVEIRQVAGQCAATVSPKTFYVPESGGQVVFDIQAEGTACGWNPVASAAWILEDWNSSPQQGSGKLYAYVFENQTGATRTATITVLGQTVEVAQYAEQTFSLYVVSPLNDFPYTVNGEESRGMRTFTFPVGTPITLVAPETYPMGDGTLAVATGWGNTGNNVYTFTAVSGAEQLQLHATLYFRVRLTARGNVPGDGSRVEVTMLSGTRRDQPDGIYLSQRGDAKFQAIDGAHSIFSAWEGILGSRPPNRVVFQSITGPGEAVAVFAPTTPAPYLFDPVVITLKYGVYLVPTGRFDISSRAGGTQTLRIISSSCDDSIPLIEASSSTGLIPGPAEVKLWRSQAAALPNGTYNCRVTISSEEDTAAVAVLPVRVEIDKPLVVENAVDVRAIVDAAAYRPVAVPSGGIATIFGVRLSDTTENATSIPLPIELGGSLVRLVNTAEGTMTAAPLFYVSPTQINFHVPSSHPIGESEVRVSRAGFMSASFPVTIYPVNPNFFSANSNGKGVAAGQAVLVTPESSVQTVTELANCSPNGGTCTGRPVDFGAAGQELFLVLYGTGFPSGPDLPAVYIDGEPAPVEYCGPQGQYVGLDQVNIRVPAELRNTGIRTIEMEYKGFRSNVVTVLF